MPNNIVLSNPGGTLIKWGDAASTPYLTLSSVPSSGTVGVAVSGVVSNAGSVSATWAISTSPADTLISPSSGTLAAGANVAFTLTALASGLKNVLLTSSTPGATINGSPMSFTAASVSPPPPPAPAPGPSAPNLTRLTNTTLFADVAATTALSGGSIGGNIVSPARGSVAAPTSDFLWGVYGPSAAYVDNQSKWAWRNSGGDWIDANGTWQGTAAPHFTFAANSVTSGNAAYSGITCTDAAKAAYWRGKWNAFIVKCTGGARSLAALHHPTLAAPSMQVTYTDSTTATLACLACVRLTTGSSYTQIGAEEAAISQSVALEFAMPTKEVGSATISLNVSSHDATPATISGYIVNPPTNAVEEEFGIAEGYAWDVGISAHPNVLFAQTFTTTALSDYVLTGLGVVNSFDSANWSPAVIGLSGTVDDTKLPTALSGVPVAGTNKWYYSAPVGNVSVVSASYTGDGFVAPPSGHGALRVVIPGDTSADGAVVGNGGSLGTNLWALFDKTRCGLVDRFTVRFMYRYHYSGGVPSISAVKMFRSNSGGTAYYAVPTGKFGPGGHHWTTTGGNNNVGGGNLGWSNRLGNVDAPADLSVAPRSLFAHVQDMLGVNFEAGKDGGMGANLYPDTWYCIEIDTTLNTYNESTGVASADGVMSIYVNGRLDATHTGWKFREGVVPAQDAANLKPFRRMGAMGLCLNDYNGGVRPPDRDLINFYSNIVVTDGPRIGRPAPPLPSWVPAPGEVTVMTAANGLLLNKFRDACAPYYTSFYFADIASGYSGSCVNPHVGTYGAKLFEGAGHSNTNDNSLVMSIPSMAGLTYQRATNPTPLFGSGTDTTTKDNNAQGNASSLMDLTTFEWTVDRQPMSSHSYGDQNVMAPHHMGGAAYGTFIRLLREGPGFYYNANGAEAPHQVRFSADTGPWAYSRAGAVRFNGSDLHIHGGPVWTAHVPAQNRIYIEAHGQGFDLAPRWFDLTLGKYITGTGTALDSRLQGNGGDMVYVADRNILVLADRSGGVLRLRYMDVSSTNPSWNNTARTLSASLTISDDWSEITYDKRRRCLIVGNVTGDTTAVYKIAIPATLTDTWTVTRQAFGAAQSITWAQGQGYGNLDGLDPLRGTALIQTRPPKDATTDATWGTVYAYRPATT